MTVEWRTPDRQPRACNAPAHPPWGIEVHHTPNLVARDRDELQDLCRRIYDYHVHQRGWNDGWYQYVVALDGSVAEMRGFGCASFADDGGPDEQVDRLTVALTGDYDDEQVTHAQRVALGRLADRVVQRGGRRDHSLHSNRSNTRCPGANVAAAFTSGSLFPPEEEDMALELLIVKHYDDDDRDDGPHPEGRVFLSDNFRARWVANDPTDYSHLKQTYGAPREVSNKTMRQYEIVGRQP